jgi:glycine oxidase
VVGGGVIGLSLAWELRKRGASVLVVERGELGGEASSAAGGMLAWCDPHLPEAARGLAALSTECYGEFVREIEEASGIGVDLRKVGTIVVDEGAPGAFQDESRKLSSAELAAMEPGLRVGARNAQWWPEWSVDPRRLMACLSVACRARGVAVKTDVTVAEVVAERRRAVGVRTSTSELRADSVVNCAGAWASEITCGVEPSPSPTRPVKGQMLALDGGGGLRHVVRAPEVYLIPRSDGTVVVGATVEEAGFNKGAEPDATERLRAAAVALAPWLGAVREVWAGLRPASLDGSPILGETSLLGYFVATGHFRDGILLAPATARVMAGLVLGEGGGFAALSPRRFGVGAAVA